MVISNFLGIKAQMYIFVPGMVKYDLPLIQL